MPDYVQKVLDFIDTYWNTSNYDPKPVLIDRRDSTRQDTGKRDVKFDLSENNSVGVSASPGTTFEPEGLGWLVDRVEAGVAIRIEGVHESEWGHIADAADFESLVAEVVQTLRINRKRPIDGYDRLEVRRVDDQNHDYGDYYRADLEAYFIGRSSMPAFPYGDSAYSKYPYGGRT